MSTVPDTPLAENPLNTSDADGSKTDQAHSIGLTRNLISCMMLGQLHGLPEETDRIFEAAAKLLGERQSLRISLAFASAFGGDVLPAKALLDEGFVDWPDPEMARLSVAMTLKIAGDTAYAAICEEILAVSTNDSSRRFALQIAGTSLEEGPE